MQAAHAERRKRREFGAAAALVVLLALLLRALYAWTAQVDLPIRGDVNQYVLYAWNLVHRGTFSSSMPDAALVADSYRGPGYPLLLALAMKLAGHSDLPLRALPGGFAVLGYADDTWMRYALASQVLLGTATVALSVLLARLWLSRPLALCAGLLVALWPHLIVFSGVLLSETLFGFTLVAALYAACRAASTRRALPAALAGALFALAYLVNPVVGLFAPMLALGWALRGRRREAMLLLGVFALAPAAWALRNANVENAGSAVERAAQNFVQGSIPQYLVAYNSRAENAVSAQIVELATEETRLLLADPAAGLAGIAQRMREDPGFYAAWYLWQKPYLLWDWSIRIGWGDIYFLETRHSPFERIAVLALSKQALQWSNPWLFVLAAAAAIWYGARSLRRSLQVPPAPALLALFFLYVTFLHDILQAEPRYSIPYRPVQIVLALAALAGLAAALRRRLSKQPDTARQQPAPFAEAP